MLGGIHATFMFRQVLEEAPWIDVIVRGEGEEVLVNLVKAYEADNFAETRRQVKGLAFLDGDEIVSTAAAPTIRDVDSIDPDWGIINWKNYIYEPLGVRVAIPNMARGCPSPAPSARSGSSGAITACATRRRSWTRSRSS